MTFQEIKSFLESKMRMSHIYQPVMIKHLLEQGGNATDKEIAHDISKYNQSQIEYYQKITNNMVGKVLRSHNIVAKQGNSYCIDGFKNLTKTQIDELILFFIMNSNTMSSCLPQLILKFSTKFLLL